MTVLNWELGDGGSYSADSFPVRLSIREFCDLDLPILMFDKDGAYIVMKLEQVSANSWRRGKTP